MPAAAGGTAVACELAVVATAAAAAAAVAAACGDAGARSPGIAAPFAEQGSIFVLRSEFDVAATCPRVLVADLAISGAPNAAVNSEAVVAAAVSASPPAPVSAVPCRCPEDWRALPGGSC